MSARSGSVPARIELPSGVELHCLDEGNGPPLLLLHGGMGDLDSWAAQRAAFKSRYRVVAFSRRHSSPNRNPPPVGHSIDVDIADLHALMGRLQTGPAHLVGTSYGASVALAFALRHRAQARSLVLAEPPLHRWACRTQEGKALFTAFIDRAWRPAADAFAQGNDRRALQLLTDGIWGRPLFDTLPSRRIAHALRNAAAMKVQLQAPTPFHDVSRSDVAQLAMPVLLVNGALSSALHRCVVDELALVLPAARRAVIEGAAHGSPFERPRRFNEAVLAFLDWADRVPTPPVQRR